MRGDAGLGGDNPGLTALRYGGKTGQPRPRARGVVGRAGRRDLVLRRGDCL